MKRRLIVLSLLFFSAAGEAALCRGKIINPVTDVCWSCVFPVKLAGNADLSGSGSMPDPDTGASPFCVCGRGTDMRAGINTSFWEPLRTAEIVRHPGCLPTLGGTKLPMEGLRSPSHARVHSKTGDGSLVRHTDFRQVHWFNTPWLFVLEVLFDENCLEQMPWDLAYLSELDPLWDDNLASFILAPEAALFANPAAQAACALDCTKANTGLPVNELYWCSGCRGSVFPLTGWTASAVSHDAVRELLAHRFAMKLSREGLLWSADGKIGQCGPYFTPIMKKDRWRTQSVYPARSGKGLDGRCCRPLGRSHLFSGPSESFSPGGEDGALLLWRRRDCCTGAGITDIRKAP